MKQIICFDMWNTLVRSCRGGGTSYADILVRLGADPISIYPIVRDELMSTQLGYEQMAARLCHRLNLSPTEDDLLEIADSWRRDNNESEWLPDAIRLLEVSRERGNTLVLIANVTWPAWISVNSKLEVEQRFDYAFLSCHEGLSKPDKRVWQSIEERYPNAAAARWMIGDDKIDDLAVPSTRGWKTILTGSTGIPLADIMRVIQEMGAK